MSSRIVSIITLGVRDLKRSAAFYGGLGFEKSAKSDDDIVWFNTGGTVLGLYPWDAMADDAGVPSEGSGFRGVTLAINLRSEKEVDEFVAKAKQLGAKVIKSPQKVFWGGYSSKFQDFDGHIWEIAHNPFTPVDANGKMKIVD
ncbi:MAG: VOC family protein [Methanomassiliicoccales archaeon]